MDDFVYPQAEQDLQWYEFGRKMRGFVLSPYWKDLTDFIDTYVDDVDGQLRVIPPGDPTVIASQAALYALNEFATKFKEDVEKAVAYADNPSVELKTYIAGVRNSSDVMKVWDGVENKVY